MPNWKPSLALLTACALLAAPISSAVETAPATAPTADADANREKIKAPEGTLIEAEANLGSDSSVVDDELASLNKAVQNGKAWQPLVTLKPGEDWPEQVTIHIRHKHGPIQLKTEAGGKQTERKWVWDKPKEWKWSKIGRYKKSDLGEKLVFMRGDGSEPVFVDAIVISEKDVAQVLPPDRPDDAKPATAVDIGMAWSNVIGNVPRAAWSLNDYEIHSPTAAADVEYNQALAAIAPDIIRVHRGDFPKQWLDADQKKWDVDKIRACLTAAKVGYANSKIKLNISSWPKWMSLPDGTLNPEHVDAYTELCVEAMRIFRDELQQPVAYWEVLNEKDTTYEKAGKLPELNTLWNHLARAMKQFDATARIGGPAFTWAKPGWVTPWVQTCLTNADFVTYHNYGIGDIYDSNALLFSKLNDIEKHARFMRATVDAASPDQRKPIFLNEYNVKWTWDPMEPRHGNVIGAVFQACVVRRAMLAGIDGAMVWHLKGNAYGLLDKDDKPRLTLPLYQWAQTDLVGKLIETTSSNPDLLEIMAVQRENGLRSVLLISKADHTLGVSDLRAMIPNARNLHLAQLTHAGPTDFAPLAGPVVSLPGYSLTLIVER
jgi:hypothetical protein